MKYWHATFLYCRSDSNEYIKIYFTNFGAKMTKNSFSQVFFIKNNKRNRNSFFWKRNWAGPRSTVGPWPFPARLARAGRPPSRPARGAAQGRGLAPARSRARRRRSHARRRGGDCGRPAVSGREQAGQRAHANRGEVANPFLEKGGARG
jgi:hypothetical protein